LTLGSFAIGLSDRIPLGRGLIALERRLDVALVSRAVRLDGTVDVAVPHPCTAVTFMKKLNGDIGDGTLADVAIYDEGAGLVYRV
jgi:hypothetical protein